MEFQYFTILRTSRTSRTSRTIQRMDISSIVIEFENMSISGPVIEPVIEPGVEPLLVEPAVEVVPAVEPDPSISTTSQTIPIENPKPAEKTNTESIDALVQAIKRQQEKGVKEYHFRPVMIDGIYCYFVLYFKYNLLTVESINVKVPFAYNGHESLVPYVLYHYKFDSIQRAVNMVKRVFSTYKQKNGDFMSEGNYNDMKLEETVIPYSPNEICCVCFENTTDTTKCGHYICFGCRDKCCIQQKTNCPICREPKVLSVYNNVMHLINNSDYAELQEIFIYKLLRDHLRVEDREEDHDSSSSSTSSSSSSSSSENEEGEEEDFPIEEEEEVDSIS